MQLGFVSAILPDLSLAEILRFTADEGLDCVELMCWPRGKAERRYAGVTHLDVEGFSATEAQNVRQLCQEFGVNISGLGYYPNPLSADQNEAQVAVDHLRKVIIAARTLGIPQVNTFIGRDWTKSVAENWPRFRAIWPGLVKFAEEQGVRIGIENCPMFFTDKEWPGGKNLATGPAFWRRMFAEIPSPNFGLNFDPSHLVWQHMDYFKPLREFASKLFHLHAKDVLIDRDKLDDVGILATPNEYHHPKLPGLGEIDWGRFFSTLYDVGYEGPICVEVEDSAFEKTTQSRKASVRQSGNYLRNFLVRD